MKIDGTNLTERQAAFCRAYIQSGNATLAYRESQRGSKPLKPSTCRSNGYRMLLLPSVQAEIERLRSLSEKEAVLSFTEKRRFLAKIVRTPFSEIGKDSDLCQGYRVTEGGPVVSMPDKLEAIREDNRMTGAGTNKLELTGLDGGPMELNTVRDEGEDLRFAEMLAAVQLKVQSEEGQ